MWLCVCEHEWVFIYSLSCDLLLNFDSLRLSGTVRIQVLLLSVCMGVHVWILVLCVPERQCHALSVCAGKRTAGVILRHDACANCLVWIRTCTFFVGLISDKKVLKGKLKKISFIFLALYSPNVQTETEWTGKWWICVRNCLLRMTFYAYIWIQPLTAE